MVKYALTLPQTHRKEARKVRRLALLPVAAATYLLLQGTASPSAQQVEVAPPAAPVVEEVMAHQEDIMARYREGQALRERLIRTFREANPGYPEEWHQKAADAVLLEVGGLLGPDLIMSVIYEESRFRYDAVSPHGAVGLMQVTAPTGRWMAEKAGIRWQPHRLQDPAYNIQLGASYLRWLLSRYDGNLHAALTAYNRGPSGLEEYREATGRVASRYSSCILSRVGLDDGRLCQELAAEEEGE